MLKKTMQRENRRHERRMPHLNNQIWIRTRFVSDNTNLVIALHGLFAHIQNTHKSIQNQKALRHSGSNLISRRCFIFSVQKPKCDSAREARCMLLLRLPVGGRKTTALFYWKQCSVISLPCGGHQVNYEEPRPGLGVLGRMTHAGQWGDGLWWMPPLLSQQ